MSMHLKFEGEVEKGNSKPANGRIQTGVYKLYVIEFNDACCQGLKSDLCNLWNLGNIYITAVATI